VPDSHDQGERSIEAALGALSTALGSTGVGWMVIGGIAVIARGVRRMTTDIDAVVQGDAISVEALVATLGKQRIVPRVDRAIEFAEANLVLLLRHEPSHVDLDVSLAWTTFEIEAIAACETTVYGKVVAPMARAEDLVILKAMAARPKDIEDASALLLMHDDIDLARVRRHLHDLATLADEPELEQGLESIIARVHSVRRQK
jgi:hypothetical protein